MSLSPRQRGHSQAEDRSSQRQLAVEIGGIQNEHHRVGPRQSLHGSGKHVVRHLLVFGARIEAIDARKIDHKDFAVVIELHAPHAMLDGDARKIRDFLAQSGEAVEQRGLARVRRTGDGDDV